MKAGRTRQIQAGDSSVVDPSMHLMKEERTQYQQEDLRALLRYVWKRSSFYRDYYASHGIRESDLAEIAVADLPFISKPTLMENFDAAVTDPRLRKKELEDWIEQVRDSAQQYHPDYIVLHTSGSSGDIAIFVTARRAWQLMGAMVARRLPPLENGLHDRTRIAAHIASHGHFAAVTAFLQMPKSVCDVLILSLMDATETVVKKLNGFQPDRLVGYSSSVAALADLALRGKLVIHPQTIIVSGDLLTASMEQMIQEAWEARIYVVYSASESRTLAIKAPDQEEMSVMDDLNILEVLDSDNRPVSVGEVGRVVVTNLRNYTLPILRYELEDYVVRGKGREDSSFTTIRNIRGRVSDALPVVLDDGAHDTIHPIVLAEFYVAGLKRMQFVSRRPDHVQIDYVADQNIDDGVGKEFRRLIEMKRAGRITFEVRRVREIDNDPWTGKLRLVRIEGNRTGVPGEKNQE